MGGLPFRATLTPILTYPVAAALGMDRFRALRTVGLVLGVAAVVLVIAPETSLPERAMVPWVLLGMVGPLLYVANAIIIALIAPPPSGSLPLAAGTLVFTNGDVGHRIEMLPVHRHSLRRFRGRERPEVLCLESQRLGGLVGGNGA